MALRSEQDFLALIERLFPQADSRTDPSGHVLLGRGDDCAVLRCPERLCLSADLFLEDVHFRRAYFLPEEVGYKALAVNVSDVSAMGARPLGFSLQLFGPPEVREEWWKGMLSGMADLATSLGLPLVGGDLSRGASIGLAVTVWGQAVAGRFLTRRTARPGDHLFLVGKIGLARAGLLALEASGRQVMGDFPRACAAHLRPRLHVEQGVQLGTLDFVRGLMDISDGLAMDLPRFLPPGLGADLSLTADDLDPEVAAVARARGEDPLLLALTGGEDYALLGACEPGSAAALAAAVPEARVIGRAIDHFKGQPGILLAGKPAAVAGFDHFSA